MAQKMWGSEDSCGRAGSLHHVGPGGVRHSYPLNHLTSPYFLLRVSHTSLSLRMTLNFEPSLFTLKLVKLGIYCHAQLQSQLKTYIFLFMCVLYVFECSWAEARRECHSPEGWSCVGANCGGCCWHTSQEQHILNHWVLSPAQTTTVSKITLKFFL